MSSFDINAALVSRVADYDGESPAGLDDFLISVDEQMWAKGELAHAIASGQCHRLAPWASVIPHAPAAAAAAAAPNGSFRVPPQRTLSAVSQKGSLLHVYIHVQLFAESLSE